MVIFIIFSLFLKLLTGKSRLVKRIYDKLDKILFYGFILRTFLEAYIEYFFASLLQILALSWSNPSEQFASVFNIVLLGILISFPIYVTVFLYRKAHTLEDHIVEQRFGSLYENINLKNMAALAFNVLFLTRRVAIVLMAVFVADYSNFQVQFMIIHCIFIIIYLVIVKPFTKSAFNRIELFNEICIISVSYHLFLFTDYMPDDDIQYNVGWVVILITLLNIGVNMILLFIDLLSKLKLALQLLRRKLGNKQGQSYSQLSKEGTQNITDKQFQVSRSPDITQQTQDQSQIDNLSANSKNKSKIIKRKKQRKSLNKIKDKLKINHDFLSSEKQSNIDQILDGIQVLDISNDNDDKINKQQAINNWNNQVPLDFEKVPKSNLPTWEPQRKIDFWDPQSILPSQNWSSHHREYRDNYEAIDIDKQHQEFMKQLSKQGQAYKKRANQSFIDTTPARFELKQASNQVFVKRGNVNRHRSTIQEAQVKVGWVQEEQQPKLSDSFEERKKQLENRYKHDWHDQFKDKDVAESLEVHIGQNN